MAVKIRALNKVRAYNSLAGYFKACQDKGIKIIYSLSYQDNQVFYSHKITDIRARVKELGLTKYTIEHIKLASTEVKQFIG